MWRQRLNTCFGGGFSDRELLFKWTVRCCSCGRARCDPLNFPSLQTTPRPILCGDCSTAPVEALGQNCSYITIPSTCPHAKTPKDCWGGDSDRWMSAMYKCAGFHSSSRSAGRDEMALALWRVREVHPVCPCIASPDHRTLLPSPGHQEALRMLRLHRKEGGRRISGLADHHSRWRVRASTHLPDRARRSSLQHLIRLAFMYVCGRQQPIV